MNDRAISILDNYEFHVLRTYKGRSAIICETDQGLKVIREYSGTEDRIAGIDDLLRTVRENSGYFMDAYEKTKEGNYITRDRDQVTYIVKDYIEGRECSVREKADICAAFAHMAKMHRVMRVPRSGEMHKGNGKLAAEIKRRNSELQYVRKYLRKKSNRQNFENYLNQNFEPFMTRASELERAVEKEDFTMFYDWIATEGIFCHGDFQHHNLVVTAKGYELLNYEKMQFDSGVRDISLLLRKVMEKNSWSSELCKICLDAYETVLPLTVDEKKLLCYRLSYPEKFWKIVNYYMNSRKVIIPGKHIEKLQSVLEQEAARKMCIEYPERML